MDESNQVIIAIVLAALIPILGHLLFDEDY